MLHRLQLILLLQPRGQGAAGIAICYYTKFYLRKSRSLVRDVFH
jgi:glutamine phosphoribosylpyrophosphate amidotransferase